VVASTVLAKTDMKEIRELPMIMPVARIKTSATILRLVKLLRTLTVLTLSVDMLANVMTDTKKSMESARILMSALTEPTSAMMSTRADVTIPSEVMTVSVRPDLPSMVLPVLISLNVNWLKFLAMLTLTALTLTTRKTEKLTIVPAEQDTPEMDLLVKITTSVLLSSGTELITSTSKPESAATELALILPVGTNVLVTADMKVQLANTQLALMLMSVRMDLSATPLIRDHALTTSEVMIVTVMQVTIC